MHSRLQRRERGKASPSRTPRGSMEISSGLSGALLARIDSGLDLDSGAAILGSAQDTKKGMDSLLSSGASVRAIGAA